MRARYVLAAVALVACSNVATPDDRDVEVDAVNVEERTAPPPMPAMTVEAAKQEPASTGPDGRDPESARELARELVAGKGWHDGREWSCLKTLWELESRWSWDAEGSTSDHGIPQAHAPAHPETDRDEWRDDPAAQIEWGAAYIAGRYGSPCAALDAWKGRANAEGRGGWY